MRHAHVCFLDIKCAQLSWGLVLDRDGAIRNASVRFLSSNQIRVACCGLPWIPRKRGSQILIGKDMWLE